mmetsp:Transcript_17891/g.45407  ORF Transcript_17891/g.45407 Transcript_17891/m.45407 type:complete len:197 (-) Transcript_17891:397-987(-)
MDILASLHVQLQSALDLVDVFAAKGKINKLVLAKRYDGDFSNTAEQLENILKKLAQFVGFESHVQQNAQSDTLRALKLDLKEDRKLLEDICANQKDLCANQEDHTKLLEQLLAQLKLQGAPGSKQSKREMWYVEPGCIDSRGRRKLFGAGSFGDVYETTMLGKSVVAVKEIRCLSPEMIEELRNETSIILICFTAT